LQLNVPPNKDGLLEDSDVERVKEFGSWVKRTFSGTNLLSKAVSFSQRNNEIAGCFDPGNPDNTLDNDQTTFWTPYKDDPHVITFWVDTQKLTVCKGDSYYVTIMENIAFGQVIANHTIQIRSVNDESMSEWETIATGTTVGYKRIHPVNLLENINRDGVQLRIIITKTVLNAKPQLTNVALHKDADTYSTTCRTLPTKAYK